MVRPGWRTSTAWVIPLKDGAKRRSEDDGLLRFAHWPGRSDGSHSYCLQKIDKQTLFLKKILKADDALDVFGVHGVGGILGALLTGVFSAPILGGTGFGAGITTMAHQVGVQALGVGITLAWSSGVSLIAYFIVKQVFGLRVGAEAEREGLDISSHGESAYEA